MTSGLITGRIKDRFEHLLKVISSERFLQMKGLGNEVPFFICPFKPQEALEIDKMRQQLAKQLERDNVNILEINLYDLAIRLLKERGIWEAVIEKETDASKTEFLELLQSVLDPETHLVPEISRRISTSNHDVLFISGIGEVFPYIRSHTILNNLQSVAKNKPTVFFFPGDYSHSTEKGSSLDLFGRLHDDNYYRAFNIYHCET